MTTATTSLPAMTTGTGRGKTLTALDAGDYKSTMQRLYAWIQQQKAYEKALTSDTQHPDEDHRGAQ